MRLFAAATNGIDDHDEDAEEAQNDLRQQAVEIGDLFGGKGITGAPAVVGDGDGERR